MSRTALVLRVDRKRVIVETGDGTVLEAQIRGTFNRARGRLKSPVAVGDIALLDEPAPGQTVIAGVEPRNSVLLRPEVVGRWRNQVLVANADRAVIVFAHDDPPPKFGLVDRLLVACHAGDVPPAIVFNKSDLPPGDDTAALMALYEGLGYEVLRTSASGGEGCDALRALVLGRQSVFAGPSGTGKSSLINRVLPDVELRIGEISRHTGKGRHTTTAAQLVRIPDDTGHVIDTPGIKEFGLIGIAPRELDLHFPEFPGPEVCKFADCRHLSEPGCLVQAAVQAGDVTASRYASYRVFLAELEEAAGRR